MEDFLYSLPEALSDALVGLTAAGVVLLVVGCIVLAFLWVFFIRIYIAYRMAKNRHRDPLGWVLLSCFFSPVLVWIILLIAGDASNN